MSKENYYGMPGWKALGFNSYKEYLLSDIWYNKKEMILMDNPSCKECNSKKNLQVHHLNYDNVGNETKLDVIVLCKNCHRKIHNIKDGKHNC